MYKGLHLKCPFYLSDFKKFDFSGQMFEKYSNINFNENPSIVSRVVPCRRTDRQTYRNNQTNIDSLKFYDSAYKLYHFSVFNIPRLASSVLGAINILFSAERNTDHG
jgi:hypothetical protein